MKKSLSLLLSFALVFGLFASMASAADTALTTAQKYQELKDKGILKGTTTGSDELDRTLTRAEFATIGISLAQLPEEKPATATFTDVTAKQWWYGAIEAAAKAGFVEGTGNGKFSPKNDVTIQEVIKIAATIAKLSPVEGAEVEGAATWAAPYVKAALDAGLISEGLEYGAKATRGQTIDIGYAVYKTINPDVPAKVSVVSAKATGVKKVEVTLDKAVDTSKATFTLKRGTTNIALGDTKWSDDKKTATLPLKDVKINEGTYTVTLGGVDDIQKATAEFVGQKEELKKIEFVTSSEEIVQSSKAKLKLRAENQYGELASYGASNYTINAANLTASLKVDAAGYLIATIDTASTQQGNYIPVFVYFDDTRVSANKTFRVGTPPFVTKLELGEVQYDAGKEAITKTGDTATVILNLFDQYGNPVTPEQNVGNINIYTVIAPYTDNLDTVTDDIMDDTYKVKIVVPANKKIEKAGDFTLTVHTGAGTASTNFKVASSKVAVGVKIGDLEGNLAAGDSNKYITLDVVDANGDALTAQEIADNADRIQLSGGSATTATIAPKVVTVGKHKGKIRVLGANINAGNQSLFVSAAIMTPGANSYDNKQFKIEPKRIAESVSVKKHPAVKAVLGASSEFEIVVKDQYGAELKTYTPVAANDKGYKVGIKLINATGVTTAVYGKGDNNSGAVVTTTELEYDSEDFSIFNEGFKFQTIANEQGTSRVEAVLYATTSTGGWAPISSTGVSIQTIKNNDPNLFYSLKSIGDIYAALDSKLTDTTPVDQESPKGKLGKQVEVVVKDASGKDVAFPGNRIDHATISSSNFLKLELGTGSDAGKAWVIGNKAGTASVTAIVKAADGTTKYLTSNANVKSDLIAVQSIDAKDEVTIDLSDDGNVHNVYNLMDLKVKDQYGTEYAKTAVKDYGNLLNVTFAISDIVGSGTVTYNHATGDITISGSVDGFVVTAVSPDGKITGSTPVVVTP